MLIRLLRKSKHREQKHPRTEPCEVSLHGSLERWALRRLPKGHAESATRDVGRALGEWNHKKQQVTAFFKKVQLIRGQLIQRISLRV